MPRTFHVHPADLVGYSRLTIDGILGLSGVVETAHSNIAGSPSMFGPLEKGPTTGITGLVYNSIRGVTALVGSSLEAALTTFAAIYGESGSSTPEREAVVSALNGAIGDYLFASGNPLAILMRLRRKGEPLTIQKHALRGAIPRATGKLLVLVHGLGLSDLRWFRRGHDHGARLARDLGYTALYLHYNSGMHISENGRAFAVMLESLVEQWPTPIRELAIIGHSMGGLVTRSACHYGEVAGYNWPRQLRQVVFLGTPHHGAPLERWGNLVNTGMEFSPYTAALANLVKIRSAGITDLRYGNLLDQDWKGRNRFTRSPDARLPLALPKGVHCYAIAASELRRATPASNALGDGIVPVRSALGLHGNPKMTLAFPQSCQWIVYERNHFDLLSDPAVYGQIRCWLDPKRTKTHPHGFSTPTSHPFRS